MGHIHPLPKVQLAKLLSLPQLEPPRLHILDHCYSTNELPTS